MIRLLTSDEHGRTVVESFDDSSPPEYAILSHTWLKPVGREPTYQDIVTQSGEDKDGFEKVRFCLKKAQDHGLRYCWVDTCCINKQSDSESSRAINSMFRWYGSASKCFVYLSDVSVPVSQDGSCPSQEIWEHDFRRSKWFTRGWTLQELLAPLEVSFYSEEGTRLGTKRTLERIISDVTKIPVEALQNSPLSTFSYDERRSWAEHRTTTEPEDMAHCLLGVLEISMPACYGEGFERANFRLESAIRQSVDGLHSASVLGKRTYADYQLAQVFKAPEPNHDATVSLSVGRIAELIEFLKFDQIEARHLNIRRAHVKTCQWLRSDSTYVRWQDKTAYRDHRGFLWIKGKPGCGKSTLMKFAVADARKKARGKILLSFFFNARGSDLEKSTAGAYRTILVQLLEQAPHLRQSVFRILGTAASKIGPAYDWGVEVLKDLLEEALSELGTRSVVLFIDALDECNEAAIRDMVSFFEDIGDRAVESQSQILMCLATRHYPYITPKWGLDITLEGTEGHTQDIKAYLGSALKIGTDTAADAVRTELFERAAGIFMWIVLVVEILNKEFDTGRLHALKRVKRRLEKIPSDLYDLFQDILTRDADNREDMLLCLQWVLFSKTPLTPVELFYAIRVGLDGVPHEPCDIEAGDQEAINRFILTCSKGLAEPTKTKVSAMPTIQFIHESVRDFLLKDGGIGKLWPDLASDFAPVSHDRLFRCCRDYLVVNVDDFNEQLESLPQPISYETILLRQSLTRRYPFIDYASTNILYHADAAAELETEAMEFLTDHRGEESVWCRWLKLANVFANFGTHRHKITSNLLTSLVRTRVLNLLQKYSPLFENNVQSHQNFHDSLCQAVLQGSGVPPSLALYPSTSLCKALLKSIKLKASIPVVDIIDNPLFRLNDQDRFLDSALIEAVKHRNEALIPQLIACGANPNFRSAGGSALTCAIDTDNVRILRALINKDTNLGEDAGFFLSCAATKDKLECTRLLLNWDSCNSTNSVVLSSAIRSAVTRSASHTLKRLLEFNRQLPAHNGIDLTDGILIASRYGYLDCTRLLLEHGAPVDGAVTRESPLTMGTPIITATFCGHWQIVQELARHGADVNAKDMRGRTPLDFALSTTRREHPENGCVEVLLNYGAVVSGPQYLVERLLRGASFVGRDDIVQTIISDVPLASRMIAEGDARETWASDRISGCSRDLIHFRRHGTALIAACEGGHENIARVLLEAGADVNIQHVRAFSVDTALRLACVRRMVTLKQVLLEHGARWDCLEKCGDVCECYEESKLDEIYPELKF